MWMLAREVLRTRTSTGQSISGDLFLRLNLMRFSSETSYHTLDAFLELLVLGRVDDGVDAAVAEHQNTVEVVKPENRG